LDKAPEAFRTISEVADELDVPKHVLRFWEAKFAQLKPMKRGGGRRYYRPEDVALLRGIRFLLYNDGYTIRGVQKILREHGSRFVMDYRRIAEDDEQDEVASPPQEIPDIAAEAAKGGAPSFTRAPAEDGLKLDRQKLGALIEEIEACQRVLAEARDEAKRAG
jgi:DNA-binding transcriptional MerR regulator